jgi:hypothetical protein
MDIEVNENLARFFHTLELQVPRMLDRETDITEDFLSDPNPKLCFLEYFQHIPPVIFTRSQNTVTNVDIIGTTCFQNFLCILRNFPHVDTLKFWNVSLDEYRHRSSPYVVTEDDKISIPHLKTIEFGSDEPIHITPGESKIIYFLTHSTNQLSLRTIKFSGQCDWLMVPVHNEAVHSFGDSVPLLTLGRFIIAAAPTLENLYCNRDQQCLPAGEELPGYSNIQLTHLSCRVNTTGIGHLLKHQNRLNSLTFKSYNHIASGYLPCIFSAIDFISSCIQRCSVSLTNIKMHDIPVSSSHANFQLDNPLELYTDRAAMRRFKSICKADLSVYEHCNQLNYLKIKLSRLYLYTDIVQATPDMAEAVLGTFINGHYLPMSLRILKIHVGYIIPDELFLLTSRFRELEQLERIVLDSINPFVITKECFQNVLELPLEQFVSCVFKNGQLANDFIPQLLLSNHGIDGLHWELTICNTHVKLYPSVNSVMDE